jgi:hypothetical protein
VTRRLTVAALLVALLAVPAALAAHEEGDRRRERLPLGSGPQILVEIEPDRTAVTPPANVSAEVRFTGNARTSLAVDATLGLSTPHGSAEREGEAEQRSAQPGGGLASFQLDLDPGEAVTRSVTVPVDGIGTWRINVDAVTRDGGRHLSTHVAPLELVGLAPLEVTPVDAPERRLVSLPEEPATYTVRLTAHEDANLSDLRLAGRGTGEPVEIGSLEPGSSTQVTLQPAREEHDPRRPTGIEKTVLLPRLSGRVDGVAFQHPLHLTSGEEPSLVHPPVYVVASTGLALIPPADAELGSPTEIELVLANTDASPVQATPTVHIEPEGLPSLTEQREVRLQAAPGEVAVQPVTWTPPASGQWELVARHDLGRHAVSNELHVAGPIQRADIELPTQTIERGETIEATVTFTAGEATTVNGLSLTTWSAPKEGTIGTRDILRLDGPGSLDLSPSQPTETTLQLTAQASGGYQLFLVAETAEGPSIHRLTRLTVDTNAGGWGLALVPTGLLLAGLGVHTVWRARWVE